MKKASAQVSIFLGYEFDSTKGYPGEGPPAVRRSARRAGLQPEFLDDFAGAGGYWAGAQAVQPVHAQRDVQQVMPPPAPLHELPDALMLPVMPADVEHATIDDRHDQDYSELEIEYRHVLDMAAAEDERRERVQMPVCV